MTSWEWAEQVGAISKARAMKLVKAHGLEWREFVEDCGESEEYDAATVIGWLGY